MPRIFQCIVFYVISLAFASCNKDEPAKAAVTKFYLTDVMVPGDLEDRILYVDDTTLSQIDIYYQGALIKTNKFQWNNDQSLISFTYVPPHSDLVETRKFDYAKGWISRVTINSVTPGLTSTKTFYFYQDVQNRLDSYEYYELGTYPYARLLQQGKATWRSDGLDMLLKDGLHQDTSIFKVRSSGLAGTSPWLKLPEEMACTMLIDQVHFLHFFISNKITSLGAYNYDQFTTDANNNLISMRRTSTQNGFVDFYKFTWKKVVR